jgi:hypothetical protein
MRIAIDLDSGDVRSWAGQAVTGLRIKRGDRLPVEVRFTRNGATIERPSGATGKLGIKSAAAIAGDFIAFASAWTKTGSGSQTVYTFDLNTNTTELHALFSAEPASVALVMEIESSAPGELRSSATVAVTVENDVIRGDEGVPTAALPDSKATQEQAEAGTDNETWMTPLRTAQAIAELGGGGGGSVTYDLQTEAFTAVIGGHYALDTTAGSFNVTLPESPTEGQFVCFIDARGTWNTNPPTFLRNGNKIETQEVSFTNAAQGTFFRMVFIDSTTGWRILESGTKPQNLVAPTISGNQVGTAITSTTGTWTGSPTSYIYKWQISDDGTTDWSNITGATAATYTPVSEDEDKYVRLEVTAVNSNGSSLPAYSAASDQIEVSGFPAGAIALWKLADTSDDSGNENTLTNNNTVTFAAGKIGNAAVFDGSNSLSLASNLVAGKGQFSLSLWLYYESGTYIFSTDIPGGNCAVFLAQTDSIINFVLTNSYIPHSLAAYSALENEWAHIAVVFDAGTLKGYVNNVEKFSVSGNPATVEDSGSGLTRLGDTENGLVGKIDACCVWDRVLSAEEIATLYNAGTGLEPA